MDTAKVCQNCGKALGSKTVHGLCPECFLKVGLGSGTVFEAGEPAQPKTNRFVPPTPAELGNHFPSLEILELLGRGGMGAVYKARQRQLDRVVALKILPPGIGDDPAFAERFTREARALAKLNHPGIVTIYDFGRANGLFYFLMELVDGVNLRQLLHTGRVSPREALAIVPQICDALQYAHDQGVVHRDIKPENILLDRLGRVKVADFGLAKLVASDAESDSVPASSGLSSEAADRSDQALAPDALTAADKVMGTPQYMAPEQVEHPGAVDHRADIYALGVVFYQMLTGDLPGKRIQRPSKRVEIDVRLDEVVMRALEAQPERRYQQASILKTDLQTIANTPAAKSDSRPAALTAEQLGRKLRGPAIGLLVIGFLNCLFVVLVILLSAEVGLSAPQLLVPTGALASLLAIGFMIHAALRMQQVQGYRSAIAASVLSMILPLGLPVGVWSLVVLSRRGVRAAFDAARQERAPASQGDLATFSWRSKRLSPYLAAVSPCVLATGAALVAWLNATSQMPGPTEPASKGDLIRQMAVAGIVPPRPLQAGIGPAAEAAVREKSVPGAKSNAIVPAVFGPEVYQDLLEFSSRKHIALDLDSGDVLDWPFGSGQASWNEIAAWFQFTGTDLIFEESPSVQGISGIEMVVTKINTELWTTASAEQVQALIARSPTAKLVVQGTGRSEAEVRQGMTALDQGVYVFKTREGAAGVLQIRSLANGPRRAKIRYKLLLHYSLSQAAPGAVTQSAGR